MEDLQSQIDDLSSRADDNDQTVQDLSDNTDSTVEDIQNTLDDHETRVTDLESNSGQLTFPLSQDTIDLIKEQFPTGVVTLVAGVATITDARISAGSVIMLSVPQAIGTLGILSYIATAGSAVVTSTSSTDTSVVAYLIMN